MSCAMRVEAVEEEVRVDLGAQRGELSRGREVGELPLARLHLLQMAPDQVVADQRHERDRDDRQQHVEKRATWRLIAGVMVRWMSGPVGVEKSALG